MRVSLSPIPYLNQPLRFELTFHASRDRNRLSTSNKTLAYNTKAIADLSWPIALNAVFLQFIVIIDTLLVTPLGEASLAAMGLASGFTTILTGVLIAFSNATQILVAQAFGAKNSAQQEVWFWSGLVISFIICALGLVFIFISGDVILPALAPNPQVSEGATNYLQAFSFAFLGLAITQHIGAFFNAIGRSKIPFFSNLIEIPINIAMSWILIYGLFGFPQMGVSGAAVGTGVAVMMRVVYLSIVLSRTNRHYFTADTDGRYMPDLAVALHFRRSLPIAGNFISMSASISVCMVVYARLGVNQFAALTLLFPWIRVAGHVVTAWGTATGILVGQLLGSENWALIDQFVSRSWRVALALGVLVSASYYGMYFIFGRVYPDLQSITVHYLWQLLPLLLFLPLIRSSNVICGHVLRAGGDAGYVFKVHAMTQWLLTVPLTLLFVLVLKLSIFWVFALIVLEELVKAVPFHHRLLSGRWKRKFGG